MPQASCEFRKQTAPSKDAGSDESGLQLTGADGDAAAIHYQVKDNEDADDSENEVNEDKTIQAK